MSLIQVSHLTFCYEGSYDPVFEEVSFELDTDWKLGFIGRNGQGKTTFLQLLMGRYEYQGTISASVDFDYFPFQVPDPEEMAIEVAQRHSPDLELWKFKRELGLLQVPEDVLYRPFFTLSNGEQTKVLLALLFLKENQFLLLDEPTNHLDQKAKGEIVRYLKGKKGFILVSHDRMLLDQCVDHILSINRANIEVQKGNFSSWRHNKELQDRYEQEKDARLKKEIKRMDTAARRTANWSDQVEKSKKGAADKGYVGHKAAKMMQRAKNAERRREQAVEEKKALLRNLDEEESLKLHPLSHHARRLVEVSQVSIAYGGRTVCRIPDFTVESGERVALVGRNGSGKSSLLKLIAGEELSHTGTVRLASGLTLSVTGIPERVRPGTASGRTVVFRHPAQDGIPPGTTGKRDAVLQRGTKEKSIAGFQPVPSSTFIPMGRAAEFYRRAVPDPDRAIDFAVSAHPAVCGARRRLFTEHRHQNRGGSEAGSPRFPMTTGWKKITMGRQSRGERLSPEDRRRMELLLSDCALAH